MKTLSLSFVFILVCISSAYVRGQEQIQNGKAIKGLTEVDEDPIVLEVGKAIYPEMALKERAEGTVLTRLYVNKKGVVKLAVITQSTARKDINEAARAAALQYKFIPGKIGGQPVDTWVTIPFAFVISENGTAEVSSDQRYQSEVQPKPVREANAVYPKSALQEKAEGTVLIRTLINLKGEPQMLEIFKSSGRKDLDQSAVAAVSDYRFEPAWKEGRHVETWTIIPIRFKLPVKHER